MLNKKKFDELNDTGLSSKFQTRKQRIIKKDGSFNVNKIGLKRGDSFNLYHFLINISISKFLFLALLFYVIVNLLFTITYVVTGVENIGVTPGGFSLYNFLNAFFFSAQTLTTVGFGIMHPQNITANIIATLEAGTGLMVFAIATGLLYGRFSRPTTNIKFSDSAIITEWKDGLKAFQFRVVNAFNTQMIDAEIQVIASYIVTDNEREVRKFFNLDLEYSKIVFFSSIWTVNHIINDSSPLFEKTYNDLCNNETEFLILLKAYDDTFAQTINTRYSYTFNEVIWGAKFIPVLSVQNGKTTVEIDKLNSFEMIKYEN